MSSATPVRSGGGEPCASAEFVPRSMELSAMDGDLFRAAIPPEVCGAEQNYDPGPLRCDGAKRVCATELAEINLQRRVGDVFEREPREHALSRGGEERHRDEQTGEQLDEPEFRANQREDGFQPDCTGADHEIDRTHQEEAAKNGEHEEREI